MAFNASDSSRKDDSTHARLCGNSCNCGLAGIVRACRLPVHQASAGCSDARPANDIPGTASVRAGLPCRDCLIRVDRGRIRNPPLPARVPTGTGHAFPHGSYSRCRSVQLARTACQSNYRGCCDSCCNPSCRRALDAKRVLMPANAHTGGNRSRSRAAWRSPLPDHLRRD